MVFLNHNYYSIVNKYLIHFSYLGGDTVNDDVIEEGVTDANSVVTSLIGVNESSLSRSQNDKFSYSDCP